MERNPTSSLPRGNGAVASVQDLRVHFRTRRGIVQAVDGVSFDIRDGETLGLVGETGCGKSVTGRSFLKLLAVPPAIFAGGSVLFHPHGSCGSCKGRGCSACGERGRSTMPCRACNGAGCESCGGKGTATINLLSLDLEAIRSIRGNRIAMIFQDPGKALNPTLTVGAQLKEVFLQHRTAELLVAAGLPADTAGALRRLASQERQFGDRIRLAMPPLRAHRKRLETVLESMVVEVLAATQVSGPARLMSRYPHELSGGMKQRVMIAQALSCNPDILIADEPTTALDVTVEARILDLIRELQITHRTSVLYISHDLSLVRRICDRVAVMYAGRLVEIGTSREVFGNPRHPYTRGLLAASPSANTPRGQLAAIHGTVPELVDPPAACRFTGRCAYEAGACRQYLPELQHIAGEHFAACFIDHAAPGGEQPSYGRRLA